MSAYTDSEYNIVSNLYVFIEQVVTTGHFIRYGSQRTHHVVDLQ